MLYTWIMSSYSLQFLDSEVSFKTFTILVFYCVFIVSVC